MGVVLRARRQPDGEVVALKVLRAELAADDVYRRRFAHEVRAASGAASRHLVKILDAGEVQGRPYIAMSYVPGPSLEERIKDTGPLPLPDVARIASELGDALDTLHRVEIVHRDVKPSNVLFGDEDSALLTDFGLAKGRAYTLLTRPGQAMGTLDYMAPELIRGQPASPPPTSTRSAASSTSASRVRRPLVIEACSRSGPLTSRRSLPTSLVYGPRPQRHCTGLSAGRWRRIPTTALQPGPRTRTCCRWPFGKPRTRGRQSVST